MSSYIVKFKQKNLWKIWFSPLFLKNANHKSNEDWEGPQETSEFLEKVFRNILSIVKRCWIIKRYFENT